MTTRQENPENREPRGPTPGPGGVTGLLLVAAFLFVVGAVPLQLAFGEAGIILAQLLLLLLPVLVFLRRGGYDPVRTLSLRLPNRGQVLGGVLVLFGGLQLAWFLTWLQSFVVPVPVEMIELMSEVLTADSVGRFLWLLLMAAVVPAVVEETLFRGAALSGFRRGLPALPAVIVAGAIFGLFHLTPDTVFRFLPTAWLGILLGWIVVVSGSLPLAILLHFLNNGLILALTMIPATREQVTGPEEVPPFLLLPVALAMLLWGLRTLHRASAGPTDATERPGAGPTGSGITGSDPSGSSPTG